MPASEGYTFWYWTQGPGGQGAGGIRAPTGGGALLPEPPPIPPPAIVYKPPAMPPQTQSWTTWGKVIPISMGQRRLNPQIIWLKNPISIGVTETADFAVSWGYNGDEMPETTVCLKLYANGTKIWTADDGNLLPGGWSWEFYPGSEEQLQDPTMVADKGATQTPAYRNQVYGVFRNFPLKEFGLKLPGITAELARMNEPPRVDSWNPDDKHPNVTLVTPLTLKKELNDPDTNKQFESAGVRSRTYHRKGQYYMEFTLDNHWTGAWYGFAGYMGVGGGVVSGASGLNHPAGWTSDGAGAAVPFPFQTLANTDPKHRTATGWVSSVAGPPEWFIGETMGFWVNMNEGWVRARNVTIGSDWTAPCYYIGSTVLSHVELGDALYAYANVNFATGIFLVRWADQQTANFGATPFKGFIPSGATAWNGTGGTIAFDMLPLKDAIERIAIYAGLNPGSELDFVGIDDEVNGLLITEDTNFRDFLMVLARAYGFDFYEGETIRIVRRVIGSSYTIDKTIPPADLCFDSDRAITTVRREDQSPTEIELNYIDRTQQFRWSLQKARRVLFPVRTTTSRRKDSFAIPIITEADDALTAAGKALFREASMQIEHAATTMPRHIDIEPSDIIEISAGDTTYTAKVLEVSIEADCRVSIRAVNLLTDEDITLNAEPGEPNEPYGGFRYYMGPVTEGADRFTGMQGFNYMLALEGSDTFAGLLNSGVLAATDRPDTFVGSAFSATMSVTDRPDTFAGAGPTVDPTLVLDLDFTAM